MHLVQSCSHDNIFESTIKDKPWFYLMWGEKLSSPTLDGKFHDYFLVEVSFDGLIKLTWVVGAADYKKDLT